MLSTYNLSHIKHSLQNQLTAYPNYSNKLKKRRAFALLEIFTL